MTTLLYPGAFEVMRMVVGISVALALFGSGSALSSEAAVKAKATDTIKVASAGDVATPGQDTKSPVTQSAAVAPPAPAKVRRIVPTLVARIDLSNQQMYVTANGKTVGRWTISSGKLGHETPTGRFRPQWSSKMHYSRKYNNSPMPYSVFFNGGIATHGTNYTSRLGGPASHGCIRLRTANARRFYQLVHRHGYKRTRIIVTGRAKFTRSASRGSTVRRNNTRRRQNSFAGQSAQRNAYGSGNRYSLSSYDRRRMAAHQRRVRQYYQSRRLVYPGDSR